MCRFSHRGSQVRRGARRWLTDELVRKEDSFGRLGRPFQLFDQLLVSLRTEPGPHNPEQEPQSIAAMNCSPLETCGESEDDLLVVLQQCIECRNARNPE